MITKDIAVTTLKQRDFIKISRVLEIILKFAPSFILAVGSKILANPSQADGRIIVDLADTVETPLNLSLGDDLHRIKMLRNIRGGKEVRIQPAADGAGHIISGDHLEVELEPGPVMGEDALTLPAIEPLGVPVRGYDPRVLKGYLGRCSSAFLAVYDDQVECIAPDLETTPYIFTAGMKGRLKESKPDVVLKSTLAFTWFGKHHEFQLGRVGEAYVLTASNKIDLKTTINVVERLEVVTA